MGREWIERPRSSILGREVCDRPIDVAGPQEFRSVIPGRSDPVALALTVFLFQLSQLT